MTDWRADLPPEYLAKLDELNAHAVAGRTMTAAFLEQVTADLRETEAAGGDAEALHVLVHELRTALGDNAEAIAALETRLATVERWVAAMGVAVELDG